MTSFELAERSAWGRRSARCTPMERAGLCVPSWTTERSLFDWVVICAGLHGDRLAISAGDEEHPRIVPFRGEYFELVAGRNDLVRALVYPVPKPRSAFSRRAFHAPRRRIRIDRTKRRPGVGARGLSQTPDRSGNHPRVAEVRRLSEDGPHLLGLWSFRDRRIGQQAALPPPGPAVHPRAEGIGSRSPVGRHPGAGGRSQRAAGRRLRSTPQRTGHRRS